MVHGILTEVDGPIGIITLNRPGQYNAFDVDLLKELIAAIAAMENDAAVSVLVISGTGQSFCSGTVAGLLESREDASASADTPALPAMLDALARTIKPGVARVHGSAYGVGAALVAICDIAVATFDAHFTLNEIGHDIPPALVSTHFVRAIGERHTRRYMLSGESFAAATAYRIGLVHEIVADEAALDDAVGEIVDALLRNGPQTLGACKQAILATRT